ncbi:hypothetical protein [Corynebacterium sputi]|uniref:hypothetical protein n=1 Tax=Corynebacterium sputi TaxID=489915 RepID=UPI0012EB525E|nr:hypothetical protein [Corynebacterium sputi]
MNNVKRTIAVFATAGLTLTGGTAVANASPIDVEELASGSFLSDLLEQFFPETPGTPGVSPQQQDPALEEERATFETELDEYLSSIYTESPELDEAAQDVADANEGSWPEEAEDVAGLDDREEDGVRCAASIVDNAELPELTSDLEATNESLESADAETTDGETIEGEAGAEVTTEDEAGTEADAETTAEAASDAEYGTAVTGDDERTYLIVCMEGEVVDQFELTTDENATDDEVATDETEEATDTAAAEDDFEFQFNPDE